MNCPLVRRIYDRFEEIGVQPANLPFPILRYLEEGKALVVVVAKTDGTCSIAMTARTKKALTKLYR